MAQTRVLYIQATQLCHFKQLFQSIHKICSLYSRGFYSGKYSNFHNYYYIENNKILRAGPQLWYEIWSRGQNGSVEGAMANH